MAQHIIAEPRAMKAEIGTDGADLVADLGLGSSLSYQRVLFELISFLGPRFESKKVTEICYPQKWEKKR